MFTVTVVKGAQTLTGFRYSAISVTFGDTAPTVTVPSGARGALELLGHARRRCARSTGPAAR